MHRASSIFGSAIFLVAAPGTVAVYAPWAISHWHLTPPLLGWFPLRVIGVFMIAGTPVLLDSFVRFAIQGLGTPAPIAPPQRLVVTGLYRWVRNPMYVSVLLLVIGQGLLFGSVRLLEYGIIVWLGFFAFVLLYEEPQLHRKFGQNTRSSVLRSPAGFPA